MALFKILRGPSSGLEKLTINDGWCYYTPDTGLFHIDYNGTRVPLNAKDAQTLSGASLVQALNREGLDKEILSAAAVDEIKENLELLIAAKQEHITGTEGQVVVIGANGSPTAVNANLSTSGGIIDQNTGEIIKMWYGTKEQYDAIDPKDDYTIYILSDEVGGDVLANEVVYDNTLSGLNATNVQVALDEIVATAGKAGYVLETNKGLQQKFWRGTKEEYDALIEKDEATMYIIVDDDGENIISGVTDAEDVTYDNTTSGLLSTSVQNAIDELATAFNENKEVVDALDEAIANKANKADVYTKTEIDNLVLITLEDIDAICSVTTNINIVTMDKGVF